MSEHIGLIIILVASVISLVILFWDIAKHTVLKTVLKKQAAVLEGAASREFEGAKPALIHATDTEIDKLPDALPLADLEAKAQAVLTTLLVRLLAANPLLSPGAALLTALLPAALAALPKTLDVTTYKAQLKDGLHKLITEAKL